MQKGGYSDSNQSQGGGGYLTSDSIFKIDAYYDDKDGCRQSPAAIERTIEQRDAPVPGKRLAAEAGPPDRSAGVYLYHIHVSSTKCRGPRHDRAMLFILPKELEGIAGNSV